MKVLIVPSWYPPDGGSFFKEQAQAVAETGISTDVLSLRIKGIRDIVKDRSLLSDRKLKKSRENGIDVYRAIYTKFPLTEKYNIHPWSEKLLRLFEVYTEEEGLPDLIHVHSSLWAGNGAALIKEKYDIPYVLTEHRSRFVENNQFAQRRIKPFHKPVISKALKSASKIILVSNKLRKSLLEIEPSVSQRMVVIPNFIDTSSFRPAEKQLPAEPFRFFSLGNLEHVKGMDILIEAFGILKKNIDTPVKLKIGGRGSLMAALKNQTRRAGIENDIIFTGKLTRSQVIDQMQNSHAFVLASRFEAFGVVFIEALATGLPVISTKSGGPEEIINNENGFLAELEDPIKLAETMEYMIKNYHRFDLSTIRHQAVKNYSHKSTAKNITDIYNEVLNE